MPSVTVIGEDGVEEREIRTERFALFIDDSGTAATPVATQNIEVEKSGNVEKTGTQCGSMRQENVASDPFAVTVECIVTTEADSVDTSVLTVRDVLHRLDEGDAVRMISDYPINKPLTVRNIVVTQDTDIITVSSEKTTGKVTAFSCQLQLGAEENDE
jgi:hypothetical protein